jgi:hypothetical protein
MLFGALEPSDNLCRVARFSGALHERCHAQGHIALMAGVVAAALIALSLALLLRWQRRRPRAISYDSDAGRWIVLGWVLAIGGAVSLLVGMLLIGSNGWPFSRHSRYVAISAGQLPVFISTVQRRYFARYAEADGAQSLCASFGSVTIRNRSRDRLSLDLGLKVIPLKHGGPEPQAAMPTRDDLAAIARRGLSEKAIFHNPVDLQPREGLTRELVFVIRHEDFALSDRDYDFALEVSDRLSGQRVSFALPAEYHG